MLLPKYCSGKLSLITSFEDVLMIVGLENTHDGGQVGAWTIMIFTLHVMSILNY